MDTIRVLLSRIIALFQARSLDNSLDEELEAHIDLAIEDLVRRGLPEAQARRRALAQFGGVQQARERYREGRGLSWLEILIQDLRFTFRTLKRDSSFTIIAVLILGLGIGANIAVFSLVNTILLRTLPFPDSQQLVRIVEKDAKSNESGRTYTAAGDTPLHWAAFDGRLDAAKILLEKGAKVNPSDKDPSDKDGNTPLHWAAVRGHVEMTEFLIAHGADMRAKTRFGCAPLRGANDYHQEATAHVLLRHGATQ